MAKHRAPALWNRTETRKIGKGGEGAKPKKAVAKEKKPTAEKLSDQERQRLLFAHKRKIKPLLSIELEAKGFTTMAFELAKKDGFTKKEIELAILLETDDGIEKIKVEVERTNRIARWMGVGKQLDLFGGEAKQTPAERYYESGKIAAYDDEPRKPPSYLSDKDAAHWFEGFDAARQTMNVQRASAGFRPLGEVEGELPLPGIGDAPATHQVVN